MSLSRFAGYFNALSFYYGGGTGLPPALIILTAPTASPIANPGTCTVETGITVTTDGIAFAPLNTNAPVLVGSGGNQEKVTPSTVTNPTSTVPGTASFAATFSNLHGTGDPVASATFGLQEAIDYANSVGGGVVVVDSAWANAGGTTAIYNAAVIPSPTIVTKQDNRT